MRNEIFPLPLHSLINKAENQDFFFLMTRTAGTLLLKVHVTPAGSPLAQDVGMAFGEVHGWSAGPGVTVTNNYFELCAWLSPSPGRNVGF